MMTSSMASQQEFQAAVGKARMQALLSRFQRRPNSLIALADLVTSLPAASRRSLGLQTIPLAQICGSEGRSQDFDRNFLPLAAHLKPRWSSIAAAMRDGVKLPPIRVFKIGERYFVIDGNHRVSVARFRGHDEIAAYVIELVADGVALSA